MLELHYGLIWFATQNEQLVILHLSVVVQEYHWTFTHLYLVFLLVYRVGQENPKQFITRRSTGGFIICANFDEEHLFVTLILGSHCWIYAEDHVFVHVRNINGMTFLLNCGRLLNLVDFFSQFPLHFLLFGACLGLLLEQKISALQEFVPRKLLSIRTDDLSIENDIHIAAQVELPFFLFRFNLFVVHDQCAGVSVGLFARPFLASLQ